VEGAGHIGIEVGLQSLLITVETEYNHEIFSSGYPPCRQKFEPGT